MPRKNKKRCCCKCGCRRTPGCRRDVCNRCEHHVCPGYCLAIELNGTALCRHCLPGWFCVGVPEFRKLKFLKEIARERFYAGLVSFQRRLHVDANNLLVHLLARFLRPTHAEDLVIELESLRQFQEGFEIDSFPE